jgi:carbon monoxide dehydrogenase subunit G
VWSVLNDPSKMAEMMPGVESFDVQDDRHWRANVKVPLGLGGLRMSINFEKTEEREPEFARLRAKGTGIGALMDMVTGFHLDEEDGGTAMRWEADVKIAGPVGSMGQRVLHPIVNQQVTSVLDALDRQVMAAVKESAPAGSGEESRPSATEPDLKDYGSPAPATSEGDPAVDAGSSGAEEGINPWAPEGYSDDPEGPTQATQGN